ncbi:MAG: hypothetical protein KDD82_11710 [Planctomycetes bacterium]|nr:hypothetical protein [Planctomycetota bacterium]
MSRKRRQRSTAIRKRIEKKQREDLKKKRKEEKGSDKERDEMVRAVIPRAAAQAFSSGILDLSSRLEAGPIRGWTNHDLEGDPGLEWLAEHVTARLEDPADPVEVYLLARAKGDMLDKLGSMEMAASGLGLDWESGFGVFTRALGQAEEWIDEEEDEDDAFDWDDPATALREAEGEGEDGEDEGEEKDEG